MCKNGCKWSLDNNGIKTELCRGVFRKNVSGDEKSVVALYSDLPVINVIASLCRSYWCLVHTIRHLYNISTAFIQNIYDRSGMQTLVNSNSSVNFTTFDWQTRNCCQIIVHNLRYYLVHQILSNSPDAIKFTRCH